MKLENKICNVEITIDSQYTVQSSDNKYYKLELNPSGYSHGSFYKTFSIHVNLFYKEYDIALIGNYYSYDADCAILNDNILTVMQGNSITQIDVQAEGMILHKEFDCFGCTFGIYSIKNGYIIYGEIEILKLDLNFDTVWSFSGRDIFVTQTPNAPFTLREDSIELYDWENNYYIIDFNGKQINA